MKYLLFVAFIQAIFVLIGSSVLIFPDFENNEVYSMLFFLPLILFSTLKAVLNYLRLFANLETFTTFYIVLFPEKLSQFEKDMLDKSKKIYEKSVIKENINKEKAKVRADIAAEKQKAIDSAIRKTRENLRKQFNNFIEENPIESELFLALKPFKDDSMPYNELVMFISNDNLILMPPKFDHIYSTIKEQVELELSNGKSTLLAIPLSQFPIHKIPLEAVVFYSVQGDFKRISKIVAMETTNVNFIENLGSFGGTKVHSVTEKHDDREVIFSFNNQQGKRTLIRFTSSVIDAFDKLIPDKVKIAGK
jgi:guanylate kinase